ncbi:putative RNA helicase [Helianthus debilis subsp. tardiflorus]
MWLVFNSESKGEIRRLVELALIFPFIFRNYRCPNTVMRLVVVTVRLTHTNKSFFIGYENGIAAEVVVVAAPYPCKRLSLEDYVHRIGRTGRAGAKGIAVTFFTHSNAKHARELVKILQEAGQVVPVALSSMTRAMGPGGSGGSFRSRGRGGFGNRGGMSGSNTVPLGSNAHW